MSGMSWLGWIGWRKRPVEARNSEVSDYVKHDHFRCHFMSAGAPPALPHTQHTTCTAVSVTSTIVHCVSVRLVSMPGIERTIDQGADSEDWDDDSDLDDSDMDEESLDEESMDEDSVLEESMDKEFVDFLVGEGILVSSYLHFPLLAQANLVSTFENRQLAMQWNSLKN